MFDSMLTKDAIIANYLIFAVIPAFFLLVRLAIHAIYPISGGGKN